MKHQSLSQQRQCSPAEASSRLQTGLRYAAIALLVLGIFFRFYNLDHKIYWIDEAYTSLRISGYTRKEFIRNTFNGKVISVETVQNYQHDNADKTLTDTLKGIATEEPQLTPLYFIGLKGWTAWFGDSITAVRSLSAVISLLAFPCLWWLCRELFSTSLPGWIAIALFAITPLQILYAQEARPYSLWTVLTLLSSAVLLWAIRTKTRLSWIAYGTTVALGLYTHLLFGGVAIAHGIYVGITEQVIKQRRLSRTVFSYLLATAVALLTLVPWLILLFKGLKKATGISAFNTDTHAFSYLVDTWFGNLSRVFLGEELYSANFVLVLLSLYALYFLCRRTPQRVWLFVLLLVGVPFLLLALPDLMLGGARSLRIRYIIPAYVGIQIALAYLFATQITVVKSWRQKLWQIMLIALITGSIAACFEIAQAELWWNKGIGRCGYFLPVSRILNQADHPLVIGNEHPTEILSLSHRLKPTIKLQLIKNPKQLKIAKGFNTVFLLNPSQKLQNTLTHRGYQLTLLYKDSEAEGGDEERLWQIRKP